jgi:DNA primase
MTSATETKIRQYQAIYKKARITAYLKSKGREVDQYDRHWLACCPFHDDKSTSMMIYRTMSGGQTFHCLGCNKQGSVLTLMSHLEKKPISSIASTLIRKYDIK